MRIREAPKHPLELGEHKRFVEPRYHVPPPRGGHKTFDQVRRISPKH